MIITPSKLKGNITAPPSKSMAHRAIICAALADGKSIISNIELSEDMKATINAIKQLGAKVEITQGDKIKKLIIYGIKDYNIDNSPMIDCRESGSTLRFMIPIVSAVAGLGTFIGQGRLPKRPIDTYRNIFKSQGIKWSQGKDNLPLKIEGKLKSSIYELPGNISSQYITGFLLALPRLLGNSEIKITGKLESANYVDMTIEVLSAFGIVIEKNESFIIKGSQNYAANEYKVEGDWSQAAFLILSGVLGEGIKIYGLEKKSAQGDRAAYEIFKTMGAELSWQEDVLIANKSQLTACDVDVSQCPDLAPVIAAAMSCAKGTSTIYGGERLKIKESDRILSVANALNGLGADVTPTNDGMIIQGKAWLTGGSADAPNDHRIAMMVGAVSSKCQGEVKLTGEHNVNKSYPSFWEDFVLLGGKIK